MKCISGAPKGDVMSDETKRREDEIAEARARGRQQAAMIGEQILESQRAEQLFLEASTRDPSIRAIDGMIDRTRRLSDSILTTGLETFEKTNDARVHFRGLMIKFDQALKRVEGEREALRRELEDVRKKLEKYEPPPPPPTPQERQELLVRKTEEARGVV